MKIDNKFPITPKAQLIKVIIFTVLSSYLYVLMEWLFYFTKPSFLDNWTLLESFAVLLIAPLPLIVFSLIVLAPFFIYVSLTPASKISNAIVISSLAFPSTILAFIVFLLVENFTYTLWEFNIGNFQGLVRYFYALAVVAFAIWTGSVLWRWGKSSVWGAIGRYVKLFAIVLLSVSTLFSVVKYTQVDIAKAGEFTRTRGELPNILVLSTDGLSASHMSAYGYHRDTTPFIKSLISQSLVVENHFTNNAKSTGSIGAFFSGKLPTKTRVIFPPDIFRGIDIYQHMPAILKKLGYHNADFSIRHYTDPYDLNMREGFDYANGREIGKLSKNIEFPDFVKRAFMNESYFLEITLSRLFVRLQHALSINDMVNPYLEVTNLDNVNQDFPDSEKIKQLFEYIDSSQAPFFAHVHLLGTHGSRFHPEQRVYSLGQEQNANWMIDFYDDSILNYDQIVQKVVDHLKENNLFEKTLIILTSDHGMRWQATERIPLILHFPKKQYIGVRHNNVQRIDVTATIIDYLGIKKPEWMQGESFLQGELAANRPIFFAEPVNFRSVASGGWRSAARYKAPYYSLGKVGVIVAQRWYFLNLSRRQFFYGVVNGHTSPIGNKYLPTRKQGYGLIVDHLQENNYSVEGFIKN